MKALLDSYDIFDQDSTFEFGDLERTRISRGVCGLDGSISIDMGSRGRHIKHQGSIRASNRAMLEARMRSLAAFDDGNEHILTDNDGLRHEHIIIEKLVVKTQSISGTGVVANYQITYRQLV